MFLIEKQFRFEAAHRLDHHDGKCARLHGHSWIATVRVRGDALIVEGPKRGMLMDFGDLKSVVQPIVDGYLDHHFLNETLATDTPTSEFVAEWLFYVVAASLSSIESVRVEETCTSACEYGEHL